MLIVCLSLLSAWKINPRPPRYPWPRGPPRASRRKWQRWKRCKHFLLPLAQSEYFSLLFDFFYLSLQGLPGPPGSPGAPVSIKRKMIYWRRTSRLRSPSQCVCLSYDTPGKWFTSRLSYTVSKQICLTQYDSALLTMITLLCRPILLLL